MYCYQVLKEVYNSYMNKRKVLLNFQSFVKGHSFQKLVPQEGVKLSHTLLLNTNRTSCIGNQVLPR